MKVGDVFGKSKNQVLLYRAVLKDKRTPRISKLFLGFALGYFFLPFDLIPDFIPVLGQLDDLIIVPLLIFVALYFLPKEILEENKKLLK